MRKAALHNLGCKVNQYETDAMQQLLEAAGYQIVPFTEEADVYVINTCSVTNMADRKSRQMLHRAKKMNPKACVVAAGCYVQTKFEEAKEDQAIDIVIGNNRKKDLVSLLEVYFTEHGEVEAVNDINHVKQEYESMFINRTAEHTRAFIKVQDGCNQFCSYCIIPFARGRIRSRQLSEVIQEVRALAANGYREVVLNGIHLSSYGLDQEPKGSLLELISEIHKVEGIERIRLGSLEPRIVTEEFASQLAKMDKICPHFHLSLQSGCDATLERMNRKYTTEEYAAGVALLRKYFEHPAITTDVIVGFPGETEEEFAITKAFLEQIHFYEMHVFKYSKRQGTRAAVMENQVPEEIKTRRSNELLELTATMSKEFRSFYQGREECVLWEEKQQVGDREMFVGHTMEYVRAACPAPEGIDLKNKLQMGSFTGWEDDELLRFETKGCIF